MPKTYTTRLRYHYTGVWDPASAGAFVENTFRLSSVFDPDFTGVGNQPRYFDQFCSAEDGAGLYKRFVVLGAKAKLEMVNLGNTTATDYLRVYMKMDNNSTPGTDQYDYEEDPRCKSQILYKGTMLRGQNVMTQYYSAKKFFGTNVNKEDDYAGSYGTNPARNAYLHVVAFNPNGNPAGADFYITIDYIVRFFERVIPGQS